MALAHFRMLVHELLNEDPEMVPKEAPLIVLDSKSAMCMGKNGRDTKHTRTCSSPRRAVRSHSLVCSKNSLLIVGIGPILNKELEHIFRSDRSDRMCVYS